MLITCGQPAADQRGAAGGASRRRATPAPGTNRRHRHPRRSQESIEAKREASVVVDVLTAEDVGKFPDKNVAEALQRIPGVIINREFGEGERVSVRGTAPNLTKTLLNGHNLATADWFILDQLAATRSFNYLMLPSEIIGQLNVYKSPEADIEEGGVGAHDQRGDTQSARPRAADHLRVAAEVYSERRRSGSAGWRACSAGRTATRSACSSPASTRSARSAATASRCLATSCRPGRRGGAQMPSLIGSALFQQERERNGGNFAVQFKPAGRARGQPHRPVLEVRRRQHQPELPGLGSNALGGGGTLTNVTVADGTVVAGTIASTPGGRGAVYDAIDRFAFAKSGRATSTRSGGPASWDGHFEVGYTEADGNTEAQPFVEFGAPALRLRPARGTPQVHFTEIDPTDPTTGSSTSRRCTRSPTATRRSTGTSTTSSRLELGPMNALKFGAKFTDHERETTSRRPPTAASSCRCGHRLRRRSVHAGQLRRGLTPGDFLDNIAVPGRSPVLAGRPRRVEQILFGLPAAVSARVLNPTGDSSIKEKTYGGYVMGEFGGDGWRGNVGVRVVQTDQTSTGNQPSANAGPVRSATRSASSSRSRSDRSYTDFLPSANVSFDLTEGGPALRRGADHGPARTTPTSRRA